MKWALIVLASLHGLIHLMGFVNEFGIQKIGALSGNTLVPLTEPSKRVFGVAWLLACCILLAVALGLALNTDWWKLALIIGAALSQLLVIIWWRDAWPGTIANALLIAGLMLYKG